MIRSLRVAALVLVLTFVFGGVQPADVERTSETASAALSQGDLCGTEGGGAVPMDLVFVLDASGSMTTNDRNRLRVTAAQGFADSMVTGDRIAAVDFTSSARTLIELSSDAEAVKTALSRVRQSGGTNIGAGVSRGLSILETQGDPSKPRFIILLTDGEGSYSSSLSQRAADEGIVIHTVALGSSTNENLLANIAATTGGVFLKSATADDLIAVFENLRDITDGDPCALGLSVPEQHEVPEGGEAVLTAEFGEDVDPAQLLVAWDFDGDAVYADAFGPEVTFSARGLDGPSTVDVSVLACDPAGTCEAGATELSVLNVGPEIETVPSRYAVVGQEISIGAHWSDPAGDLDAPFGVEWSWLGAGRSIDGDADTAPYTAASPGQMVHQLAVTDDDGARTESDVAVTGVLRPLSCLADRVDTPVIWPPNHKFVEVGIVAPVQDDGTEVSIDPVYVHQDEALDAQGDGYTSPDAKIEGGAVSVLAERSGTGDGRVYTIGYRATAADGRTCIGEVQVGVPHAAREVAVETPGVRVDSFTGATVDVTETPTVELPATLERSTAPVAAVVEQGDAVALTVEVANASDGDAIGILGDGPALGSVTSVGPLACEPWGDGTTCVAEVVYTAGTADFGTDSFDLTLVADGAAWRIPATVTVAAVNDAPSLAVSPPTIDMMEDGTPILVRLTGWDSETPASALHYRLVEAPDNGLITVDGVPVEAGSALDISRAIVFAPAANFAGSDEFVVAVADEGDGGTEALETQVVVPVTVRPVADAPEVSPFDTPVTEDQPATFEFTVADADSPGVTVDVTDQPAHGTATVDSLTCEPELSGSVCSVAVTYSPDADYYGDDAFALAATDGELETDYPVSLTVSEVNDAPTIANVARQIDFGSTLTVSRDALAALASSGPANEQAQALTFALTSEDTDLSVVAGVGQWVVTPVEGAFGEYALTVSVCDDGTTAGAHDAQCAEATLTLTVLPPNTPPVGAAVAADTDEDTSVEVSVAASDEDGDELTFDVVGAVSDADVGLGDAQCTPAADEMVCAVTATVTPAPDWSGVLEFAVRASDGVDAVDIPVTVTVAAVDDAPSVTAPATVSVDEDSSADISVVAADVDTDGADLSIRISAVPEHGRLHLGGTTLAQGDVVAGSVATVTYAPDADYAGEDAFSMVAVDGGGGESPATTVAVTVQEVNDAPTLKPVVIAGTAGETVTVSAGDLLAGASAGPANEASQVLAVDAFTLDEGAPATLAAVDGGFEVAIEVTATEDFTGTVRVCDDGTTAGTLDAQCAEAPVTFAVGVSGPDLSAPVIVLGTAVVADGSEAVVSVETYDASGPIEVAATVNGEPVAVTNGALRYTPPAPGHYTVVVTATDAWGLSASATTAITVLGEDDGVAPTVALDGPAEGATLTSRTPVRGSVDDSALAHWEVTLTRQGATDARPIVIGEGSSAVADDELGVIDPSVLAGGQYVIELEAIDDGGRISRIVGHVFIEPEGKYGPFSMTFTDAVVPVAGIPLTVQRTYESAARFESGDFGYGWSLSVNTMRLERDTPAGESWVRENHGSFLPNYVLVPTASHTVTVVDSAANSMIFDFTPSFIDPITDGRYATASWTERTSTGATLEPLDTTELVLSSGYLISLDDADIYDPDAYRLTMPDGRVFDFDLDAGLTRIEDASGVVVTITDGAIESSAGAQISLMRDGDGRITSIETPGGAQTSYAYDAGGNLVRVTDAGDNATTFAYDGQHLLTGIVDPLGRIPSRQEFDADGRLIAVVDADGNRTEIDADPDARTTTVTDRLGHTTVQQFNADGYLIGQVFADGTSESYTVDDRGNRLSRTDGAGNTWTATYDARDNRRSVTDPLGHTRSFTYDEHNWLTSSTNELDETTSLTYDGLGNVTRVDFPDSTFSEYTYDAQGNTLTETDESGRTWTYTYDGQGRRLTSTSPGGHTTSYAYDDDGRLLSTEAPEGGTTSTTYDARGLATEAQNALGGVTSTTFDAAGQRTEVTYPTGVDSSMTYDNLGRLVTMTTAGATTTYAYDLEGRVTRVESPTGLVRETDYDERGRVEEVRENGAVVSATTYDDAGRVATSTDALGRVSTYTYDAAGRLTQTLGADGTTVTTTYDDAGRLLTIAGPSGTTTYTYDVRGRIATEENAGEPTTTFTYDAAGRVLTTTGADGTTTFTYDADGRLATATDANGSSTSVGYNGDGRRVTVDDARGHSRTWTYDDAGNLLTFDVEGVRQLTQAFDSAGRVTSRAIGDAAPTVYAYNGQGLLESVDAPDAPAVTYGYDASGLRTSVTDARGTTTYAYDSRARLTGIDAPEGDIAYTYDSASRVATIETAAGVTSYDRDDLGRIIGITDPAGGAYVLDRDDAGRVESIDFPNGVTESYTFDAAGRPLTVTVSDGAAVVASFEVTRDQAGRIATFLDSVDGQSRSGSYDYDAGGRLVGASSISGAGSSDATFGLDAAGNRESVTGDGAETSTFNALDQLTSDGAATYAYDDSGFLTTITDGTGATDLSWSASGRLESVDGPGGAVSYEYDPAGVLVARTDGAGTVGFVNDASQSLPHAVAASDGSWWVYAGAKPLAQATPDGQVHYLHGDVRGDVSVVTDASGAMTDTVTYAVDGQVVERTGTTPVSVGWNGEWADPATGMVWLRARWYDPAQARFISADPWHGDPANPVSLNRYLYANGDPVNNVDPTGHASQTLLEKAETMAVQSTLYSIRGMSVSRANFILQSVLNAVVGLGATAFVAVQMFGADDPRADEDIDGPGPEPEPQPDGPRGPNSPPPTLVDTCQVPPGQDPDVFYHYTRWSTVGEIAQTGVRAVYGSGKTWISSVRYATAAEAQSALALPDPPPDGYYEVPRDRLDDLYGPYCVSPYFGQLGGGLEYWTTKPINMEGLVFRPFAS